MQVEAFLNTFADLVATRVVERVADRVGASNPIQQRLLTVDQAAAYLGRSKASLQHLISDQTIPVVRHDRRVFLDRCDLDEWIDAAKSSA